MNDPKTQTKPPHRIIKHLQARLLSGVLVLVPLAVTLFILNFIFHAMTAMALPFIRPWLRGLPEYGMMIVAFLLTAALIYLVGSVATHIIGKRLFTLGESILLKLPIVKTIYSASKQVVDAFSLTQRGSFQALVMIEFPRKDCLALAFVTGTMQDQEGKTYCRIFLPTAPNPTSGFLLILPESEVRYVDIPVEDGIKMIISGGMLSPSRFFGKVKDSGSAANPVEKTS